MSSLLLWLCLSIDFFFQFTNLLNLLEIHAAAPCIIYDCHGGLCEGGATHLHVTMYSSMMSQSFYFGYMGNCLIIPTFHVLPEFFIKKKEKKKKRNPTSFYTPKSIRIRKDEPIFRIY